MCLADDINIKIYYQDTDSMHIKQNDINKLWEAFESKYSRSLVGTAMG